MIAATFTEHFERAGIHFRDGSTYLLEDVNADEFAQAGAQIDCNRFHQGMGRPLREHEDMNGMRILFVRPGGFGDLLFLTPIMRSLKLRWPGLKIDVACFERFGLALLNNPAVDRIIPYPFEQGQLDEYDAHYFLENVIEGNPMAITDHAIDVVADYLGWPMDDPKEKGMHYFLTQPEYEAALRRFPRIKGGRRLAVQVAASSPVRTYPYEKTIEVICRILKKGWEVFLLGAPHSIAAPRLPGLYNLTEAKPSLDFRESVAAMATCDVVLAPDSALVHVAGALKMQTVALYGPFPADLRTRYATTIKNLEGKAPCAPCFYHSTPRQALPPGDLPCQKAGYCTALGSIEPKKVVQRILKKGIHSIYAS